MAVVVLHPCTCSDHLTAWKSTTIAYCTSHPSLLFDRQYFHFHIHLLICFNFYLLFWAVSFFLCDASGIICPVPFDQDFIHVVTFMEVCNRILPKHAVHGIPEFPVPRIERLLNRTSNRPPQQVSVLALMLRTNPIYTTGDNFPGRIFLGPRRFNAAVCRADYRLITQKTRESVRDHKCRAGHTYLSKIADTMWYVCLV